MNNYTENVRFKTAKTFMKKYGYFVILGLATLILAVVIGLAAPANNNNVVDVDSNAILFADPVANASILKEYSDSELMYNTTLNQWEAHKAIDFVASDGTDVLAVFDGTVEQIYTNYMEGTVVVINHGNNLKTLYASLNSEVDVEEGEEVEKGDIIGTASDSAMNETSDGSHLHFEVWEEGTQIDPSAYLASFK